MKTDLAILGGGLAGMSLALQVRLRNPDLRIVVLERNTFPVEESAFKIGEATVEVTTHYFANVLGLRAHLEAAQLPKLGQRFFWSNGRNDDLSARLELGCRQFPPADTFQMARGRFENHLAAECVRRGIELFDGVSIREVEIGAEHVVRWEVGGASHDLRCRWVVDASGNASLLKRKFDLARDAQHPVSSAWVRVNRDVRVDDWNQTAEWKLRHGDGPQRRLSVNHLMGDGYWVWHIPLATGATSIGVVADERRHPHASYNTLGRLQEWLGRHEPQSAAVVADTGQIADFGVFRNFARHCAQVYSEHRWFITGTAGAFVDPFYSPGSDFIAYSNTFITELITSDHRGEPGFERRVQLLNQFYLRLVDGYFAVYRGQYELFGNARVMPLKICWDWSQYWTFNAFAFCHDAYGALPARPEAQQSLQRLTQLNTHLQAFFLAWHRAAPRAPSSSSEYLDWLSSPFLRKLNARLVQPMDPNTVLDELSAGLVELERAASELVARGVREVPALASFAESLPRPGGADFYGPIFEQLGV